MSLEKIGYLLDSTAKKFSSTTSHCTNCGADKNPIVDRKYWVTELRRCKECNLLYRTPVDREEESSKFYQSNYKSGVTTEMPSETELNEFKSGGFRDTNNDYQAYISILRTMGLSQGSRIFEYGCSWGYGSWQIAMAGYDVTAFEISKPRAKYAREKLDVSIIEDLPNVEIGGDLENSVDCFFTSHVLEHVPSPSRVIELAKYLVRPGGYLLALTPNGSNAFRQENYNEWHRLWGKVHPNFIDAQFWQSTCENQKDIYLESSPVNPSALADFLGENPTQISRSLKGSELVCIMKL